MIDSLEQLEALNPLPEQRGNPGPVPEPDRPVLDLANDATASKPADTARPLAVARNRAALLVAVAAAALGLVALGALLVPANQREEQIQVTAVDDMSDDTQEPDSSPTVQAPAQIALQDDQPAPQLSGQPSLDEQRDPNRNPPFLYFRADPDAPALAAAQAFLSAQFPDLAAVSVTPVEIRDDAASLQWRHASGTSGWIVLRISDGQWMVQDMIMTGFTMDLHEGANGARGELRIDQPAVVRALPPYPGYGRATTQNDPERALGSIGVTEAEIGQRIPVQLDLGIGHVTQVRIQIEDASGRLVGAVVETLEQGFDRPLLQVATHVDDSAELQAVLRRQPLLVYDFVTYDAWRSARTFASSPFVAFEQFASPVQQVPEHELTLLILTDPIDEQERIAQLQLLEQITQFGMVVDTDQAEQRAETEQTFELAEPIVADRYTVAALPQVAPCAMAGVAGSPGRWFYPDSNQFETFATPQAAADSQNWRIRGRSIEFVDAQGLVLGYASVDPQLPRLFLSVIGVQLVGADQWIVTNWQHVGC